MHPHREKSYFVKYAGSVTSDYAIATISHVSLFSTVITNEFVGEGFYLSQRYMDGYEAMGLMLHKQFKMWSKVYLQ